MNKRIANKSEGAVWPEALAVFLLFLAITQDGVDVLVEDLNLHKIVWSVLYFGSVLLVVRLFSVVPPIELLKRNFLYLVLVAIALSSMFWTIDQISTGKRLFHLSGQLLLAIGIAYTLKNSRFISFTFYFLSLNVVLSMVVAIMVPDVGVGPYKGVFAWQGLTYHKNNLAMLASLCMIFSFFYYLETKGSRLFLSTIIVAALSAIVVYKTNSATALVSLILTGAFAVALYLLSKKVRWLSFTVLFFPVFFALGIVLFLLIDPRLADLTQLVGRSETLTDRTEIWTESWKLTLDKPFSGYGFGTIFYPISDLAVHNHYTYFDVRHGDEPIVHAHNGFLTVSTQLGMPAAVIAIYIVMSMLFKNLYLYLSSLSLQSIGSSTLALFLFIYNLTEDTLFSPLDPLWTLFLVFLIMPHAKSEHVHASTRQYKRKRQSRRRSRRKADLQKIPKPAGVY